MKPFKVLNRLMGRNPSNMFVAELHSVLAQPLFVEPRIGSAVVNAYLHAEPSAYRNDGDDKKRSSVDVIIENGIAVLSIDGALVNKEMSNVPCSKSPVSYEAIKREIGNLMNNDAIHTIVGRFDTPGGVASQNVDISDYIYNQRGKGKKLIAMIDDMAYSAGIAISSAFDEVWITRTGGTGSVGVVTSHIDQSKFDKNLGISVEFIYAGEKKVEGNGHEPLSNDARSSIQAEVDRLYGMFVTTVARNFGMSEESVIATQAGTFHGQDAIDIGFAHKLGTFEQLMESLMTESTLETTLNEQPKGVMNADNTDTHGATTVDASADAAGNVSTDIAAVSDDTATLQREAGIKAICATIGKPRLAADFIASGMSIAEVQSTLTVLTSTESMSFDSTHGEAPSSSNNAASVWDRCLTGSN